MWKRLLLLILCSGAVAAQPDAEVLRLLNQDRPATAQLTSDQIRVVHPQVYPGVTLVGFSTVRGSTLLGTVIVNGKAYPAQQACPVVLQTRGWEEADGNKRTALAQEWLEQGVLAFGEKILDKKPSDFPSDARGKFHPRKVSLEPDGGVKVEAWIGGGGSKEDPHYKHSVYQFTPKGEMKARLLERVQAR